MTLKISINNSVISDLVAFIKANSNCIQYTKTGNISKSIFDDQVTPCFDKDQAGATDSIVHFSHNRYDLLENSKNILNATAITNSIIYSPYSCMKWHTNSDDPGTRIYYSYTKKLSIFRYLDCTTGEIVDDIDNIGWTARRFEITDSSNPFWHTIWTESVRFSFGFKL